MAQFPTDPLLRKRLQCGCLLRMTPERSCLGIDPCGPDHALLIWNWLPSHIDLQPEPESDPNQIDILGNTGALE